MARSLALLPVSGKQAGKQAGRLEVFCRAVEILLFYRLFVTRGSGLLSMTNPAINGSSDTLFAYTLPARSPRYGCNKSGHL